MGSVGNINITERMFRTDIVASLDGIASLVGIVGVDDILNTSIPVIIIVNDSVASDVDVRGGDAIAV
jgi:hypothetical protein